MKSNQKIISVCTGKTCSERHSSYILKRLEADKEFYEYPEFITIEKCLCQWSCKIWPNVVFDWKIEHSQNPVKSSEILRTKVLQWKQKSEK